MTVRRNADGFTSFPKGHPLENFNFGNPITHPYFMEDFLTWDIGQAAGHSWTHTSTGSTDTVVGPTGVGRFTLTTDNDIMQCQLTEAPWQTNSKRLYFMSRFSLNIAGGTIAQNELFVGMSSEETGTNFFNNGGTALAMQDAIGFYQFDGGTGSMGVAMREATVGSTEESVLTLTDDTFVTVAFVFDGTQTDFYTSTDASGLDMRTDNPAATLTSTIATSILTPTIYLKCGESQANIFNCDYIFVGSER